MEFLFYLPPILHSLLPCRIRHGQLNAALPQTVKPGVAMKEVCTLPRAVGNYCIIIYILVYYLYNKALCSYIHIYISVAFLQPRIADLCTICNVR